MNMDYIKGNLLTVMVSTLAVIITVIVELPLLLLAFLVWLGSFLLDACYTYLNRQYIQQYELNILVRRSKDIELAFIKVAIIESVMITAIGMVFDAVAVANAITVTIGTSRITASAEETTTAYSASFILFASIHVMAFARSYIFIKKREEGRGRRVSE